MNTQELIERAKEQRDRDAAEHCPAEIIALQDEVIAGLEALQAENERLREMYARLKKMIDDGSIHERTYSAGIELERRNAELQAKLDELQRQEPIGEFESLPDPDVGEIAWLNIYDIKDRIVGRKVYAAPKALEPLTDCRIELVTAIHTLASHYENRLHRLDADDRKLAEGDIAHAIKIASKWNWNGITKGTP